MDVEGLCNQVLVELGVQHRIGDIYEGSKASRAALEIYSQTRDELLDSDDWPFARRTVALGLLKGPPPAGGYNPLTPWTTTYPKPGWLYEYTYPTDCLEFNAVIAPPMAMFDLDPQPAVWRVDNDSAYTPARKVLLTNIKNAMGVYTAQVVDIDTWEPGFIAVLVKNLKAKLAVALGGNLDTEKLSIAEAGAIHQTVDNQRG